MCTGRQTWFKFFTRYKFSRVKPNTLASFQVKAGDKTGVIQAAPFISNQEIKPFLRAYCFRISVCNVVPPEYRWGGPHFTGIWYSISKPAESTIPWRLVWQMGMQRTPQGCPCPHSLSFFLLIMLKSGQRKCIFSSSFVSWNRKKMHFLPLLPFLAQVADIK